MKTMLVKKAILCFALLNILLSCVLPDALADNNSQYDTKGISETLDSLEQRDGVLDQWKIETWAEFGRLIQNKNATSRNEWLYQNASYQMPPIDSVSTVCAIQTARDTVETDGQIKENIICCLSNDQPIYKICLKITDEETQTGRYSAIWCIEIDCISGRVLERSEYTYNSDEAIMMYVPFSLLDKETPFDKDPQTEEQNIYDPLQDTGDEVETGDIAYMYFIPFEKQIKLKGCSNAIPSQGAYENALAIAEASITEKYGSKALSSLGDYHIGTIYRREENVDGVLQDRWEFIFTTDPKYLSDGYRVQIYKNIENNLNDEIIVDVDYATTENG